MAIDVGAGTLQVYNAHLGTALLERRYQAERLAAWVHGGRVPGPKLLFGDFNEWSRPLVTDILATRLKSIDLFPYLRRRRTYPGFFPLLHLDHIYYEGNIEVRQNLPSADSENLDGVGPPAARGGPEDYLLVRCGHFVAAGPRTGCWPLCGCSPASQAARADALLATAWLLS